MSGTYRPAEDSLLLLNNARGRVHGSVLDMGTGSGFIAVELASESLVEEIWAVDIDPKAVDEARKRAEDADFVCRIRFLVSDLFQELEDHRFDWILFNPPYLPSEGEANEVSWAGGESGGELLARFLSDADKHLKRDGAIILVYSSLTGLDLEELRKKYLIDVLGEAHLFFERLVCLMLRPVIPSGVPDRSRL